MGLEVECHVGRLHFIEFCRQGQPPSFCWPEWKFPELDLDLQLQKGKILLLCRRQIDLLSCIAGWPIKPRGPKSVTDLLMISKKLPQHDLINLSVIRSKMAALI